MSLMSKPSLALLVAATLFVLAGCGRRGDLEAPDAIQAPAKDDLGAHKSNPKITPPKKDFVLDPLLR